MTAKDPVFTGPFLFVYDQVEIFLFQNDIFRIGLAILFNGHDITPVGNDSRMPFYTMETRLEVFFNNLCNNGTVGIDNGNLGSPRSLDFDIHRRMINSPNDRRKRSINRNQFFRVCQFRSLRQYIRFKPLYNMVVRIFIIFLKHNISHNSGFDVARRTVPVPAIMVIGIFVVHTKSAIHYICIGNVGKNGIFATDRIRQVRVIIGRHKAKFLSNITINIINHVGPYVTRRIVVSSTIFCIVETSEPLRTRRASVI